jgi:hypothetical protein
MQSLDCSPRDDQLRVRTVNPEAKTVEWQSHCMASTTNMIHVQRHHLLRQGCRLLLNWGWVDRAPGRSSHASSGEMMRCSVQLFTK